MTLSKKYYLQALIKANYSGYKKDEPSTSKQAKFQLRDLLNTEITGLQRTAGYDPKYLVVRDEYIFFKDLFGVLVKNGNVFYRVNLSNVYVTQIHLSEHGKDGIYSFGKLEGIIHATIDEPIEETVLPAILNYKENAEKKQIQFVNNTSGSLTEVDSITAKPTDKKQEVVKVTKKHIGLGEMIGWLILILLACVLLANFWKYIGVILLIAGCIFLLSFLAGVIKELAGFVLAAILIIGILSWLFSTTTSSKDKMKIKNEEDKKEITEIRKDPNQLNSNDSILIVHHRLWNDYAGHNYETDLIINQSDYFNSKKYHADLNTDGFTSESAFWSNVYQQLSDNDKTGLHFIYNKFDSISTKNNLNQVEFANMVVSCVQDIPYVLVANLDCEKYKIENPRDVSIINQTGCFGPVKFGVQSPNEFMYNLKGDCDTRTLFCYTILSHYNYDVSILSSDQYRHSILGVSIPVNGSYKTYNGKKYYLWETTARGCVPGFLAPDFNNLHYWDFALLSK